MSRRLETDAKLVLEKAGYDVKLQGYLQKRGTGYVRAKNYELAVFDRTVSAKQIAVLNVSHGTVDNNEVERLLQEAALLKVVRENNLTAPKIFVDPKDCEMKRPGE